VLAPEARETLLRHAAEQVIRAAIESGTIDIVLVVSPDPEALVWVAGLAESVSTMSQRHDQPGLNGAIDAGRDWARTVGATAIVSLFADLPLVRPEDIRGLTARPESVVIGPDRRGEGTNALLLRLAGRGSEFRFAFGERSLVKHLQEARRLGLDVAVHDAPGIGFDLDTPDDWSDFLDARAEPGLSASHDAAECGVGIR
jgi:2-phospho-L-lactate guanylyltransferase